MADRCDHCGTRMDGLEVHADDCPVRGPEIAQENKDLRGQVEELTETLERARTYTGLEADGCPLCTYVEGVLTESCSLHRQLEGANLEIGEMKKIIQSLEWCIEGLVGPPRFYCPECDNEREMGHLDTCKLGFTLHGVGICNCTEKPISDIPQAFKEAKAWLEGTEKRKDEEPAETPQIAWAKAAKRRPCWNCKPIHVEPPRECGCVCHT